MRYLLIIFLFVSINAKATHWYVSAAGSNSNNGTSTATPLLNITGINSKWASIAAGDTISFRSGDIFTGTISITKSGTSSNRIVINSYGKDRATISGYTTLTSWTLVSTGIYSASFASGKANFINVSYDGMMQRMGRYPNDDQAPLRFESFTGNTSITDNQLTNSPNWTGAEVYIRKFRWVGDRSKITNHTNSTITYGLTGITVNAGANQSLYTPSGNGWGFFIQNDIKTLDKAGEWYFNNTTKVLNVFTDNPALHIIKAAAYDTLINLNNKQYITIDNIDFEGANVSPISSRLGANIIIKNCSMTNNGYAGIQFLNTSDISIDNCSVNYSLSTGIQAKCPNYDNISITNTTVNHSFMYHGMGDYSNDGPCLRGITVSGDYVTIKGCSILNSGYSGIHFQGNHVLIRKNLIDGSSTQLDDNGGIYTYVGNEANYGAADATYVDRLIDSNIIINAIGNNYGATSTVMWSNGIYFDGKTMNVDVKDNFIANAARSGATIKNPKGVHVTGNIFFNDSIAIRASNYKKGGISDFSVKRNIFVPTRPRQINFIYYTDTLRYASAGAEVAALVALDSSYLYPLNPQPYRFEVPVAFAPMSLSAWQSITSTDLHAVTHALYKDYAITSLGANKFANPNFTSNITGVNAASLTASWDNTGQISGGSCKVAFTITTPNTPGLIHMPVGAVDVAKNYIVRFKSRGTNINGVFNVYFRQTTSPNANLSTPQFGSYNTAIKQHEFIIRNPTTSSAASFVINFDRSSGTTYIDDVEVYEAVVSNRDLTDSVKTVYSTQNYVVSLPGRYKDFDNTVYNGTDLLSAYTSQVYFFDSAISTAPLVLSLSKTNIACFGSSGTISASTTGGGGTISYQWLDGPTTQNRTGLSAGTYTVTASDTKGHSATGSITITSPAAALVASATYGVIYVSGGTTNVSVSATGGTTPYVSGLGVFSQGVGSHNYPVGDANGCRDSVTVTLTLSSPPSFTLNLDSTDVDCWGASTGAANSSTSGASAPVVYAWTGPGGFTSSASSISSVKAGVYTLTATDALTAVSKKSVTINEPTQLVASNVADTVFAVGDSALITVSATGGSPSYGGTGSFYRTVGLWSFTVTDSKGCTSKTTANVVANIPPLYVPPATTTKKIRVKIIKQ